MSTIIPDQKPVTITDRVRLANCPVCWQEPGKPCMYEVSPGDHLARWQRAERRGLIGRADLADLISGLDVIAGTSSSAPSTKRRPGLRN